MSLKIYFCGSIRGGRDDAPLYAKLIEHLKSYGTVLTEHVGTPDVLEKEAAVKTDNLPKHIHDRDIEWMTASDVLVAEVTQPSLGVGYEIGRAVDMGKPILCMFRPNTGKSLSCMIDGAHNGGSFIVQRYQEEDAFKVIDEYMSSYKK